MITKEIIDNQLFVYHNGRLIYKKWLNTGVSIVCEKHGGPTWSWERDNDDRL
jgi:hypothetical protein